MQLAPAARLVPQLLVEAKEDAFVPVTAMLEIARASALGLVRVTCCVALVVPNGWAAKVRLVADSVGALTMPVPVTAIVWGELPASSTMVTVPLNAPTAAGLRVTVIVQFAPTATLCAQVLPNTNEVGLAPAMEMPVTASAAVPLLVRVTTGDAVAVPNNWRPKVKLVAESVGAVTSPVPLSAMLCGELVAPSVILTEAVNGP